MADMDRFFSQKILLPLLESHLFLDLNSYSLESRALGHQRKEELRSNLEGASESLSSIFFLSAFALRQLSKRLVRLSSSESLVISFSFQAKGDSSYILGLMNSICSSPYCSTWSTGTKGSS